VYQWVIDALVKAMKLLAKSNVFRA